MIRLLPFILSILFHILFVLLLTIKLEPHRTKPVVSAIEFEIEPDVAQSGRDLEKTVASIEQTTWNSPAPMNADTLSKQENISISMRDFRQTLNTAPQKKEESVQPIDSVSLARNRIQSWFSHASEEGVAQQSSDRLSSIWTNKMQGTPPLASQIPPKEIKPKIHAPAFNFIPTVLQAEMLRILFKSPELSLQDLYATITDTFSCTQQSVNEELSVLYHHGIIQERKVVLKPPMLLFGIAVETNSLSRKNPIYYYQPNIKKEIFVDYLQSLISRFAQPDSLSPSKRKAMEDCLLIISDGL